MRYLLMMVLVCLAVTPAMAQFDSSGRKIAEEVPPTPMSLEELLPAINKNSVINSEDYVMSRNLLKRKVADSEGKVIGEVRDVYVGSGGAVPYVGAVFSRLSLTGTVALDVAQDGVNGSDKGYLMNGSAADVKAAFPAWAERTKSAPVQDAYPVSKLPGSDVMSAGGEEIGKLKEILFDKKGTNADLAFIVVNYGPLKNQSVVVPFALFKMQDKRGKAQLVASNEDLEVVFKFLGQKRK